MSIPITRLAPHRCYLDRFQTFTASKIDYCLPRDALWKILAKQELDPGFSGVAGAVADSRSAGKHPFEDSELEIIEHFGIRQLGSRGSLATEFRTSA